MIRYRTLTGKQVTRYYGNLPSALMIVVAHDQFAARDVGHCVLRPAKPGEPIPDSKLFLESHKLDAPAVLTDLFVEPNWRGRGIACEMVDRCLRYASKRLWRVSLVCRPYRKGGLDARNLRELYCNAGMFVAAELNGETYMST